MCDAQFLELEGLSPSKIACQPKHSTNSTPQGFILTGTVLRLVFFSFYRCFHTALFDAIIYSLAVEPMML